jgi:hypothetical protein
MTTSNTLKVKEQILSNYDAFSPIPKVADVKADIKGTHYRVCIRKNAITKVTADRKPIWTPESDKDPLKLIDDIIYPVAEVRSSADIVDIGTNTDKKADRASVKKLIDKLHIQKLVTEANKSTLLKEGDEVRFRVATSHGKPICAHIDLYNGDTKLATAGVHHRIGFAARGLKQKWYDQVDAAIAAIYAKLGNTRHLKRGKAMVQMDDKKILDASGNIGDLIDILESL